MIYSLRGVLMTWSEQHRMALFPLNTVLFPGGILSLRIFEPRYLDMISRCLRNNDCFGICFIRSGKETGQAAEVHRIGTSAEIIDWKKLDDGLLGITVQGVERFKIISQQVKKDQLIEADIRLLEEATTYPLPEPYLAFEDLLETFLLRLGEPYTRLSFERGNAVQVVHRLAGLLPVPPLKKQHLLEEENVLQRLHILGEALKSLGINF